jgi:hypothetical protein
VVHDDSQLVEQLERRYRCVARQRYLGTVYDLTHARHNGRESPPASQKTSWWRRLLSPFRGGAARG